MSILHLAIAYDDVAGGLVPKATVVVTAALDGDAVVAGVENAVLDEHVLTSLRVATVSVRSLVPNGHSVYGDVLREEWVYDPERGVEHFDSLDEDALASHEVDELRTQALSFSELSLVEWHAVFGLLLKFGT